MATDEEYLDNLLKSITENEVQPKTAEEMIPSEEDLIPEADTLPEDGLLSADQIASDEESSFEEETLPDENASFEDEMLPDGSASFEEEMLPDGSASFEEEMLPDENALFEEEMLPDGSASFEEEMLPDANASFEEEPSSANTATMSDDEEWMADLKNLMNDNTIPEDDSDLDASMNDMSDVDIEDLLSGMGDMDDELEEISGLLKQADSDEPVDADMLAMLNGMDGGIGNEESPDPFAALTDDSVSEEAESASGGVEEETSSKAQKKRAKKEKTEKKKRFFGKKKRVGQADGEEEVPALNVPPIEAAGTGIEQETDETEAISSQEAAMQVETGEESGEGFDQESGNDIESEAASEAETTENSEQEQEAKEKKQGFFARLIHALTQEEDEAENISEENKEILNELEEEDKKNSKKKEKKEKKGGKKKKGKEAEAEGEEEESAEDADGKKKKPKKEKKPKEEKPKEKSVKVLSKRNLLVLIAFCATIIGSVILLSFFLPEYADKKLARSAYNAGDYESVYTLLYDRNLNSGDLLIFNRAATIRKMERRVESYENNLAMGRELEALDSLLKGVACYQTLTEADEFGVRQEVDALYQQICSILDENYGITVEEAMEINTYDSENYTRRLYSAVNGTSFTRPGGEAAQGEELQEETAEPSQPQDILPDEEEIISY